MSNSQKPITALHPSWLLALVAGIIFQVVAYSVGVGYFESPESYAVFLWVVILSLVIIGIILFRVTKKRIFAIDEEE